MADKLEVLNRLSESLRSELNANIQRVVDLIDSENSFWFRIPSSKDMDLSIEELSRYVIEAANVYTEATRFNGMVKAELAKAEGLYKKTYNEALDNPAKNAEGRIAVASVASNNEWEALQVVKYLAELSQAAENAARVASESARKLLDKSANIVIGDSRVAHGQRYETIPTNQF